MPLVGLNNTICRMSDVTYRLNQGFSNILVPGTPFRGKRFPRTPLIFITVIKHKVNV